MPPSTDPDETPPKARKPKAPARPKAVKPVAPKRPAPPAKAVKAVKPVAPKRPAPPAKPAAPSTRPQTGKRPKTGKGPPAGRRPQGRKRAAKAPAAASKGQTPDPLIGTTVGRCRIEALIGLGRTARVYRAHYEAVDQVVAIKILRHEVAKNPILVERFQSEARALAQVDNENVLKIYDVGTTDGGQHYMVVELLEGEEILDLIQREGHVAPMDALRIVRQSANGLGAAHGMGLVHRDIKPQNLFLLEDGTVKVVDFGLAARIDDTSERVGTPHYMAPEVCKSGTAELGSDIYGLGIVLYHLLVGQPPYAGMDIQGMLMAHIAGEPLRPERAGQVPKAIGDLVRALTKRDPLMRPTAQDVVEQVDAIGGKELRQKDSLRKRSTRSRARMAKSSPTLAIVVVAVVVVGGLIAFLASGDDDTPRRTPKAEQDGTGANPTSPSAILAARKKAAEEAAREQRITDAAREKEAQEALARAETWARENWHVPDDTEAVLAKYRYVLGRFKKTKGGDEAKRRVKMIKRKALHPHPDREWTTADAVADARAAWKTAQPLVEAKIAAFEFNAAKTLIPPPVSDEGGVLARRLDFWRAYTTHLIEYRKAATRAITNIPQSEREIETPAGTGTIKRITTTEIEVQVGHKTLKYTWAKIGPEAIGTLTLDLFSGDADALITQLALTYAFLLDSFWDAQLELGSATGARKHTAMMQAYEKRFRAAREK